ncbi:hypothetical protein AJ85_05730 [Alkalihalobacillus alcalophilus ATCC 27647 = CGMCC 1.3604]|uniref:Mor transcription activator domain-containing protein n=1 Tax=Alkalihalobacillus alcalophilus ATCC 27647 = CGMCC 1.3604 TaxID=1218173 RepID=A0A4S4K157_ALKAL|nr:Mor transcription activator family protein [Alkalihalobacillus alcalophilus]YP_009276825.1 late transcriptional activator [Bacillus phage BalMu-1]AJA42397.1 hypothetical protein BalMu1_B19 [Bacillus phage BalMu-1]AJA42453.1 hypothetical protein BalMu1_A19 [Bacillus phage BalMu-1]MED1561141.1 Mor transcription activator family protein [Alkalihalobacillus alcalophilus]THG91323.1 hypothetical protein AJ85_05730 [Alkalihalobacillus alcalophilus ATCC 27647 = CGMCC 1.3604]
MEKWMHKLKVEDLPEVYQNLAQVIGVDGVIKMTQEFGGTYMYIPKVDGLLRVARDQKIAEAHKNGDSIRKLAREFGISDSRVRTILNEYALDQNQLALFD